MVEADTGVITGNRWVRLGGGVGVLSMAVLILGIATGPNQLISTNSSVAKIAADVGAHTGQAAVSNGLAVLGAALFVWFAATLANKLTATDRHSPLGFVVLASAVIVFVFGSLDNIVLTALGFISRQDTLTAEPQLTRLLYHLYNGLLMPGLAAFGFAPYLAAVGLGALNKQIRPGWLAWPSLALAVLALVNGLVGITTSTGGANPVAPLAVLGFVVATVAIGVAMLREQPHVALTDPAIGPLSPLTTSTSD